jgi:hypothetical protein
VPAGNYFIVVRHRNHLSIRSSVTQNYNGGLGTALSTQYDFSTAQTQAYQNPANTTNAAMTQFVGSSVYVMWGGSTNGMLTSPNAYTFVRANGANTVANPSNDLTYLLNTILGGSTITIIGPGYYPADITMDGLVKANGANTDAGRSNDYTFLLNTILSGNTLIAIQQHQ